ncbi:hypothetical protein U8C35_06540 [Sinorhizobium medicae]|uniref:hypothetical protein n=1 Tax=Sinorhizobium medicae TaxID=110321 RepID=UPI002AF6BB01|nr:hypothetical protein [Sinorhizobium medicae]WQO60091.1 hypothetical protein U8C35_06540 [Sinorhizobium medicae]
MVAILATMKDVTMGVLLGEQRQQAKAVNDDFKALDGLGNEARSVDGMSDADVVQYLKGRGMYRVRGKPPEHE